MELQPSASAAQRLYFTYYIITKVLRETCCVSLMSLHKRIRDTLTLFSAEAVVSFIFKGPACRIQWHLAVAVDCYQLITLPDVSSDKNVQYRLSTKLQRDTSIW